MTYLDLDAFGVAGLDRPASEDTDGRSMLDRPAHDLSGVVLNLVGGDCAEDIDSLEADQGFCRILRKD